MNKGCSQLRHLRTLPNVMYVGLTEIWISEISQTHVLGFNSPSSPSSVPTFLPSLTLYIIRLYYTVALSLTLFLLADNVASLWNSTSKYKLIWKQWKWCDRKSGARGPEILNDGALCQMGSGGWRIVPDQIAYCNVIGYLYIFLLYWEMSSVRTIRSRCRKRVRLT